MPGSAGHRRRTALFQGVAQRLALRKKGSNPHQLMMSATPIPRTLAMSYYADLDVTVLDGCRRSRTRSVKTRLVADSRRDDVVGFVKKQVEGGQAYWVCPLIEGKRKSCSLQTAQETYETLSAELSGLTVGLVHGRPRPTKTAVIGTASPPARSTCWWRQRSSKSASRAECEPDGHRTRRTRFGLSQLHQLRGQSARGARESILRPHLRRPARRSRPPAPEDHLRE